MFWILVTLIVLHQSQAYVLLTANMEDIQSITRQLVSAPMMGKLRDVWRSASDMFKYHIQNPERRSGGGDFEDGTQYISDKAADKLVEDIIALGKNASVYIQTIKRAFNNAQA